MLVLLTKRKLRPDGCQTVKPPGILAMPNIFSPPFFFKKLLWQVQDFLRIPRMFARSQTNILLSLSLQFSCLLFFSLSGDSISVSLSIVPLPSPIWAPRFGDLPPLSCGRGCRCRYDCAHCSTCSITSAATSAAGVGQRALTASKIQQGQPARSLPEASPHPLGYY